MPFFGGGGNGEYVILTNNNIDGGNNVMATVTGVNNIGIGNSALQNVTTGSYNVAFGTGALSAIEESSGMIAIGNNALSGLPDSDIAGDFIVIGDTTGRNLANFDGGRYSIIIGNKPFKSNELKSVNFSLTDSVIIASKHLGGAIDCSSSNNINCYLSSDYILGELTISVASFNRTIEKSVIFGSCTYNEDRDGEGNVAIGYNTTLGGSGTAGNVRNCIAIGNQSQSSGLGATSAAIAVGYLSKAYGTGIAIGVGAQATANNKIRIGDASHTDVAVGAYSLDYLGAFTWASIPSAAGNTGRRVYITDIGIGGSFWFSDGARWRTVSDCVALHNNYTDVVSVANTTEQILDQYLFPAALIKVGDIIRVKARLDKSSTVVNCLTRVRLGTVGDITDAALTAISSPQGANRTLADLREFVITDATTARRMTLSTATGYGSAAGVPLADAVISNISNALYLSYSTIMTTDAETMTLKGFVVELITCGA